LAPLEKGVLQELLRHRGKIRSHSEMLSAVWDPGFTSEHAYVRTTVQRLRSKLGDQADGPSYIVAIPGGGYMVLAKNGRA
jgi:two-component system KDP operon response regulator KdpE